MANFSATGTVIAVVQRGKGHVVSLKEKDDKPHIDIYTFGTPPAVGQEVICAGYVNGREYNGKVYPDLSGTFAVVIHAGQDQQRDRREVAQYTPPQHRQNPPHPVEVADEDIPF
jgi:hypothetical protein